MSNFRSLSTTLWIRLLPVSFSHQCYLMVFHWRPRAASLSNSSRFFAEFWPILKFCKLNNLVCTSISNFSHQVSRTRLRIMAVLSNAVVWIVSTNPPTSKSSRPFSNPLVIVPNAPITIGTIVTFMFHNFFNSLARSRYLSFFSLSFRFILWSAGTAKSTILQILFFFFC